MKKNYILTVMIVLCCSIISCNKENVPPQTPEDPSVNPETPDLTEGWVLREDMKEYLTNEMYQTGIASVWSYTPSGTSTSASFTTAYGVDDYMLLVNFNENGVSTRAWLIFGAAAADDALAIAMGINENMGTQNHIPSLPSEAGAVLVSLADISGCYEKVFDKALNAIQTTFGADIDVIIKDWIKSFKLTADLAENWSMPDVYTLEFLKVQDAGIGKERPEVREYAKFIFDYSDLVQSSHVSIISNIEDFITNLVSDCNSGFLLELATLSKGRIPKGYFGFDANLDSSTQIKNPFIGKSRAEIAALTSPSITLLSANKKIGKP